jgi:signal transduction histidine kinase
MAALPVQMNPGPFEMPVLPAWTPLRTGLGVAWGASLLGLTAAALGAWSLLVLSERRIRVVSAVTHELRTPLTTLRLYLDMLAGGLVAPAQQEEYVRTLHGETDRLNRLVSNVLDFSRLENQRPRLGRTTMPTADLLEQVRSDWHCRCQNAEKELVVENETGADSTVTTDVQLVQQVLGNLVDNACKYSQSAEDRRIFLRAKKDCQGRLVFAVEDRGPGVAASERRSIFRAFRRGQTVDATTGGVGLGLALAQRWARLLGGRLLLEKRAKGTGACFRLEMPKRVG